MTTQEMPPKGTKEFINEMNFYTPSIEDNVKGYQEAKDMFHDVRVFIDSPEGRTYFAQAYDDAAIFADIMQKLDSLSREVVDTNKEEIKKHIENLVARTKVIQDRESEKPAPQPSY